MDSTEGAGGQVTGLWLVSSNAKEICINVRKARTAATAYIEEINTSRASSCNEGGGKAKEKQTLRSQQLCGSRRQARQVQRTNQSRDHISSR